MHGIQDYKLQDGAKTTWDLWQEEVVKNTRLRNALRVIGIDPLSVEKDSKYDAEVYVGELKNG